MPLSLFSRADFASDSGDEIGHGFSGLVLKSQLRDSNELVARKIIHETRRKRAEMQTCPLSPISRELAVYREVEKRGGSDFVVKCLGIMRPGESGHVHGGLVLEFMDCGSLHDLLLKQNGQPLPEPVLLAVGHALFSACEYLHSLGLLHRDIKPSNILFNSRGEIKLCDFGEAAAIAACQDSELSRSGGGGSLAYMAPERLSAQPHGPAADIWSIGIVLLEAALGRFPFSQQDDRGSCSSFSDQDCSMVELWETITDASAFPPPLDPAHFSSEFIALIAACLQKNPALRPSPTEVLQSGVFNSRIKLQ